MAVQAGVGNDPHTGITTRRLEAHYLAGGNVPRVINALIAAHRADIDLDFDRAAATTTNLGAIKSLLRLLSPSQRVLYPVTNSGYGIGVHAVECTEDSPLKPISRCIRKPRSRLNWASRFRSAARPRQESAESV